MLTTVFKDPFKDTKIKHLKLFLTRVCVLFHINLIKNKKQKAKKNKFMQFRGCNSEIILSARKNSKHRKNAANPTV